MIVSGLIGEEWLPKLCRLQDPQYKVIGVIVFASKHGLDYHRKWLDNLPRFEGRRFVEVWIRDVEKRIEELRQSRVNIGE